jgi:hypothetical protein
MALLSLDNVTLRLGDQRVLDGARQPWWSERSQCSDKA